jgi:hypothetical protein
VADSSISDELEMAVNVFTRMEVSSIKDVEKVIITLDQQSEFELLNN